MLQAVGQLAAEYTPEPYARQMMHVKRTQDQYVISGTPFTTVTVNNSYATGVHTDKGDLDEGISCLTFLRRGDYAGGQLVFPQYRVAVDGGHGDLILMDAHQWHGNVGVGPAERRRRAHQPCLVLPDGHEELPGGIEGARSDQFREYLEIKQGIGEIYSHLITVMWAARPLSGRRAPSRLWILCCDL